MKDGDSFGAGSYPEPPEEKEKTIKAKIYISFDIEEDVPEKWHEEEIKRYIKEYYNDFDMYNIKLEDIDL